MVKDLQLQASTEIHQGAENNSPSTKEQPNFSKSAILRTDTIPSSPLSCSMGIASQVASTAGHLPTPNQILYHKSLNLNIGNDHLHANNDYSNRNMDEALTATTNSSSPILPEGKSAEVTEHQSEKIKMTLSTEKAVQKKRGRGRPPKLKPSKQEKELEHQREEVSSIRRINIMNSFEKDPLCEDFDSCSMKEYNLDVLDQCPSTSTIRQSISTPSSASYVSNSVKVNNLIPAVSPSDCILEDSNDRILMEMEEDSVGSDSWQSQSNCHNLANQMLEANVHPHQNSKSRASGRPRGRPKIHNMGVHSKTEGNTSVRKNVSPSSTPLLKSKQFVNGDAGMEEELDNSTDSVDVATKISPRKLHKKFGQFQECSIQENETLEGDTSSQESREVSDSSKERMSYDSDVNTSLPIKVKSRWRNSSQYDFHNDNSIDATLEDSGRENRCLPDLSHSSNNLGAVPTNLSEKNDQLDQSVQPKRECRTRAERRSSSRRTSPVQSDILNPSTTHTQKVPASNTKSKQQNTHKSMESSVAASKAVTTNPTTTKETMTLETRLEIEKRLKSFEHITTNKFICER